MRPRGAIELLEESVSLLRSAPAGAVAAYLTGAIPFLLVLLFFFTEMVRSPYASERLAVESFAAAVLLLWKHVWQAIFAARLHGVLSPRADRESASFRMVAIQCAVQPLRLAVVPLSLLATVPFAVVIAFFRNLSLFTALGDPDPVTSARRLAGLWTRQNWVALSIVSIAAVLLFGNVMILLIVLPQLAHSFLGIENDLTRLGAPELLNSTTAAVAAAITWLAIDPLLTAFFVLRCFYGLSIATGEDLKAALRRAIGVAAMVALMLAAPAGAARAQAPPPPVAQKIDAQRLDQAIDQTIRQREFTWRSPPSAKDDPNARWTSWLRDVWDAIARGINWVADRIYNWFRPDSQNETGKPAAAPRTVLEIWTGAVAAVLIIAAFVYFFRRRKTAVKAVQVAPVAAAAPNLEDESLTADELPEGSWRQLAEESLARGEYRFALRALYLAGLNYMSGRELISIRRWKSGLDYRRELERRVRANPTASPDLAPVFASNVARFEQGWYGRHPVDRQSVEALLHGLDEMRRNAESR